MYSKRKRNSTSAAPSNEPTDQGAASTRRGVFNQIQNNVGRIEAVEIDLTDDDDPVNSNMEGSLPKKKKMDDGKGNTNSTNAKGLHPNVMPTSSTRSSSKKPEKGSARTSKANPTPASSNGSGSGNGNYFTAPEPANMPQPAFKMPDFPAARAKKHMPPPAVPGSSSSLNASSSSTAAGPRQSRKKKQLPSEREAKQTEETRKLRSAIVEAIQEELEQANEGLEGMNFDDLVSNLKTMCKIWPDVYASMRYPQVAQSDDRSHEREIVEFAHWWLFGLSALFFAAPEMEKPHVREDIKKVLRTACQFLSNGHPSVVDIFIPLLLGVLRDLSQQVGGDPAPTMKIYLPKTEKEEKSGAKTRRRLTYNILITEKNEWAIPHYLDAVSILFPRIFFHNPQYRQVLMELLKRLGDKVQPVTYGMVLISILRNGLMPAMGYLTGKVVVEMMFEILKLPTISTVDLSGMRKLFSNCELDTITALAGNSGAALLEDKCSELLYSRDFAMLYLNDDNKPFMKPFELLLNRIWKKNNSVDAEMIKISALLSTPKGIPLNVVLHPLVEKVIVKELLASSPVVSSSGENRAHDASLLMRILGSWKEALNHQLAFASGHKSGTGETSHDLLHTLKFLQNTTAVVKLVRNVKSELDKEGQRNYQYLEMGTLQKWSDVACFALSRMSEFKNALGKHQLYASILDTIECFDSCSWVGLKLPVELLNNMLIIAGWPWLKEFGSQIPSKLKPLPMFTRNESNLQFIKNSELLMAKALRILRLETFRPWMQFVLKVYSSLMSASSTYEKSFLLAELLSGIAGVGWPFKELSIKTTLAFLIGVVQRDVWKVESNVRMGLGDALAALPCVFCFSLQRQAGPRDRLSLPLPSGCDNCSKNKYLGGALMELEQQYVHKIMMLAAPVLQSTFLSVKFRIIELINRCSNHMKNPSAAVALPLINVAFQGKAALCQKIFEKCGVLLVDDNRTNFETECHFRLELAQKLFRGALPHLCLKVNKAKLPLSTRMKILIGIHKLSQAGFISVSVFVEIMSFLLLILSQSESNDLAAALLCQKIVCGFAEMHRCVPHEVITRIRSETSRQFVKVAIKRFYEPNASQELEEKQIEQCSQYIETLKGVGGFSFRNTFAKYYYPSLMEEIVPKLHSDRGYQFFLTALSKHAVEQETILLQETIIVWYPTLLLDHGSETVTRCLKFLLEEYRFNAVFTAKQHEQRILNEALCRLYDREEKVRRFLSHLCNIDDNSSQVVFSQGAGASKPPSPSRSEIQELLDQRMLSFFLHLDTKLKSRIKTVEVKKRILRSFVVLMGLMGKSKMTQLRTKTYQSLSSVIEQGPEFHSNLYEAWKALAGNLDNDTFSSMTCSILAALLPLRQNPATRVKVDGLISHFVCFKKELTSVHHLKLYFLLGQCNHKEVTTTIDAAVKSLKEENWSDYFNMLVQEAGNSNSHIRYQAFLKLHDVFKYESGQVERFVLAKGQQNASRVISILLGGLKSAAGDDKMRLAIASCFGSLGALDPVRFRNGDDDNEDSYRKQTGSVGSGQLTTFCLFYVQELIREFEDAKEATVFDYCVCLIRNLFKEFSIELKDYDKIWGRLSKQSQEAIKPMLATKYVPNVEEKLPEFKCPLYLSDHGKNFEDWLLNWLTVLIKCITKKEKYAYSLFAENMFLLRRNARIAAFLIPFVAMNAIFCADSEQLSRIILEMQNILKRWTTLEKRKAEITFAVKDSEAEVNIFEEPTNVENESVFHFRCTQIVFSVLSHLLRSMKLAKRKAALKKANEQQQARRNENYRSPQSAEMMNQENISQLDFVLKQIPSILLSQVAFDSQSSATALFYIEQELKTDPSDEKLQKHLDYLQRIYVSLNDMDSVIGIAAVRKEDPSPHERVLENIAEGKVQDYMTNIEKMTEDDPSNLTVNYALVQAYLSVDEPGKAQRSVDAIIAKRPEWEVAFQEVQLESLVKLKKWEELGMKVDQLERFAVLEEKSFTWNIAVSRIIAKLHRAQFDKTNEIVATLRQRLVAPLVAASEEMNPYKRAYEILVQLHILKEVEDATRLMKKYTVTSKAKLSKNAYEDVKAMVENWDTRLMNVSESRKVLDQVLNVRKSVFEILKSTFQSNGRLCTVLNSSIRECWLDIATDASRCANFIRADKSLSEAKKFMSPKVFIQEAKILARKGTKETAISVLQKGISNYFPHRNAWRSSGSPISSLGSQEQEDRMLCSKGLLFLAKLCEEQKLLDRHEYIEKYKEATEVYQDSEKNHFTMGSYYDRLWSKEKDNCDLQVQVCKYYSKSLLYGCKYVYQSLPRLLSIWFDHAATVQAAFTGKGALSKGSFSNSSPSPSRLTPCEALNKMQESIEEIYTGVPPYVLMTAFSQLISRLCHAHTQTWAVLKEIFVKIILAHPYQTLWMTMAVHNSVNGARRQRCLEIYNQVGIDRPSMKATIKDYTTITDKFLGMCQKNVPKSDTKMSLAASYDVLPKLIRRMGNVLIPFQIFMNPSLPLKGFSHLDHDPYPQSLVFISGIEDSVDIMSSLVRPKKITLIASNGKRYGVMCKPKDDLRKDSKLMEVNNVVNWYLRQNSESSQRHLHVRTYAVVPLNEECGLLEWVPNLQPLRHTLMMLYKENEIPLPKNRETILLQDPLEIKKEKFRELFLNAVAPIFSEWFFNNFTDHLSWYAARTSFIRTAAVMSMVGYIMGLGDRHGENILLDCVTGEVVHVDFNCLFNKGEQFQWPEKVPFRLTQNMVDGMGPLKYEGVFRRCCQIVMNMFRTHQNVFISVLRPFVYDPLVEWQEKYQRKHTASLQNGEQTNEKAVDTMNYIRCRLNGTARNMMKDIDTELSVEAQVKFLIDEATSIDNLCQMYSGWMAHL